MRRADAPLAAAGNGPAFHRTYAWLKRMDTSRPVQYENAREESGWDTERLEAIDTNTDIFCPMYPSPAKLELYAATYEHAHDARPLIMCVDASQARATGQRLAKPGATRPVSSP